MADQRFPWIPSQEAFDADVAQLVREVRREAVARVQAALVDEYADVLRDAVASEIFTAPSDGSASDSAAAASDATPESDAVWIHAVLPRDTTVETESLPGIGDRAPRTLTVDALSAVVCDIRRADVVGLADSTGGAPDHRLIHAVRAHDAVVDAAFRSGPVMPLRFGTVVADDDEVVAVVRRHRGTIEEELDRLSRGREWGVTLAPAPRGAEAEITLPPQPATGSAHLHQRNSLRTAQARRTDEIHAAVNRARTALRALSEACTDGPVYREDGTRLLMNTSFLVPASDEPAFLRQCDQLSRALADAGIHLERSGPRPPYHFASAELQVDES